jgi:hypothetical protein
MNATVTEITGGKYKVNKETAEVEFIRICDANRIDHDTTEMSEDELKSWNDLKDQIVRLIKIGTLIVGDDGKPTYTPPGGSKGYTFHPATGATFMALETYDGKKNAANLTAAMVELTHSDRGEFSKLPAKDFNACMRVLTLFLAGSQ